MRKHSILISLLLCCGFVCARTIYVNPVCGDDSKTGIVADCNSVDGPVRSVSEAVNLAQPDDIIELADGNYSSPMDFNNYLTVPNLTIRSANGPQHCIFDGTANYGVPFVFLIDTDCYQQVTINGLKFQDFSYDYSAIISVHQCGTIKNCVFESNPFEYNGVVIRLLDAADLTLENCRFSNNASEYGIIYSMTNASLDLEGCEFENNVNNQDSLPYGGGAITFEAGGWISASETTFYSNRAPMVRGGAILMSGGVLTADHCEFESNLALYNGGAISVIGGADVRLESCSFTQNQVTTDSMSYDNGAALYANESSLECTDCIFNANSSNVSGGAIRAISTGLDIDGCIFSQNHAAEGAGIVTVSCPALSINDSTFSQNTANVGAGVLAEGSDLVSCSIEGTQFIMNQAYALPGAAFINFDAIMKNCLFAANTANSVNTSCGLKIQNGTLALSYSTFADNGSLASNVPAVLLQNTPATIRNSILWNPDLDSQIVSDGTMNITYCDIYDGWVGVTNMEIDPEFAADGSFDGGNQVWIGGDYHLKARAGRWNPGPANWVNDDTTSPCVDAADPYDSLGDEPMPNGNRANLGAYGQTQWASKSAFCYAPIPGDVNADCQVNMEDIAVLSANWLQCNLIPPSECAQ